MRWTPTILAVDLGKFNSVLCWNEPGTRDDALKLVRIAAVGEIDGVPAPTSPIRQWKSLIGLRKRLVSGGRPAPVVRFGPAAALAFRGARKAAYQQSNHPGADDVWR